MRQVGVMAAMGLYAIEHNWAKLGDDHRRARTLYTELEQHGFRVARKPDTNMFFFQLPEDSAVSKDEFGERLKQDHGVLLTGGYSKGGNLFRVVTHIDLSDEDIERAGKAMIEVCRGV